MCVEKWLMFRANVDPTLVHVTDSLFCIQTTGISVIQISIFQLKKKIMLFLNELERVDATAVQYLLLLGVCVFCGSNIVHI